MMFLWFSSTDIPAPGCCNGGAKLVTAAARVGKPCPMAAGVSVPTVVGGAWISPFETVLLLWLAVAAAAPPMLCIKKLSEARFEADQHSMACAASDGLCAAAAGVTGAAAAGVTAVATGAAGAHTTAAGAAAREPMKAFSLCCWVVEAGGGLGCEAFDGTCGSKERSQ